MGNTTHRSIRSLTMLAMLAAATTALAAAPADVGASAAGAPGDDYVVTMGAVDPALGPDQAADPDPTGNMAGTRTDRFEYLAFYPENLRIHRGDTVFFRRDGFHTVEFAPSVEEIHPFFRRDELEGITAIQGFTPSDPTCVSAAGARPADPIGESCVLSESAHTFWSGDRSARLTFDLPPGVYEYHCQIHLGMTGAITIVDPAGRGGKVPSPAEVDVERAAALEADTASAAAVIDAGQTPKVEVVDGVRVWTVRAGDYSPNGHVAVLRFLPSTLTVEPGDEVKFEVPASARATELHTTSFPASGYPLGFLTYLNPTCDPDEPDGGLPNVPLQFEALVLGCPAPSTFELQVQPWGWRDPLRAPGDVVATEVTVHDSGFLVSPDQPCMVACDPWTEERWPSSSRAIFPAVGTFAYVCNVHPEWQMNGSITVAS